MKILKVNLLSNYPNDLCSFVQSIAFDLLFFMIVSQLSNLIVEYNFWILLASLLGSLLSLLYH